MSDLWITIATVVLPAIFGGFGWLIKQIYNKLEELDMAVEQQKDRLAEHKLYAANTFTPKQEVAQMRSEVLTVLNRIEEKLDKKADK